MSAHGALVWASSSTRINCGCLASAASRLNSERVIPLYSETRFGRHSNPFTSAEAEDGHEVKYSLQRHQYHASLPNELLSA